MKTIIPLISLTLFIAGCTSTFKDHAAIRNTTEIKLNTSLAKLEVTQEFSTYEVGNLLSKYFNGTGCRWELRLVEARLDVAPALFGPGQSSFRLITEITDGTNQKTIFATGVEQPDYTGVTTMSDRMEANIHGAVKETFFEAVNYIQANK